MTWNRLWPLSGIAYVFLLAVPFFTDASTGTTDAEITAYYADAGHRTMDTFLYFALLGAGVALTVFSANVRQALHSAGGSKGLADLAFGCGIASAALLAVVAGVWVSISATYADESFALDPNTARLVGSVGYWLVAASVTMGGGLVLAMSLGSLRATLLWRWLAWAGIGVAATTVAAVTFLPLILYAAWMVVSAVGLIARTTGRSLGFVPASANEVDAVA